jgi:uncharacterized repeat protein (TIGR02543 family)
VLDTHVNKLFKVIAALAVSFVFVLGSATVMNLASPADAAPGPFTCTSDFYQVSNGDMYQYSVATNTYTKMAGSSNVSNLNAIGYNTADNYIYGIASSQLYKISSDGSHAAGVNLTGATAQSTGGDFIAPNKLLTADKTGDWSEVNVATDVVSTFTETTGSATWTAADFAFDPTTSTGYGMTGSTLFTGFISGTTVAVSSKTVTGLPVATKSTDAWGAAYVDSAGDAYFFDNTTFELVEISAAGLASASPSAVSITQANALTSPNDGASCPTASSPLAPTVTTTAATSVTTSTATLNGTVATGLPTGSNITTGGIVMCYSTSNTLVGGALSVSPVCAATTPSSLPLNSAATAVTLPVTGLSPGTTYYMELEATNADGLEAFGSVLSLTTSALPNQTVSFDGNGGTGSMTPESDNVPTALPTNTFSNPGFAFAGWNTIKAGGGTTYLDGATYPFDTTRTLYAQWTALPNQTVTFDGNGGTGSMTPESDNAPTALTANGFTNPGFAFAGWNTIKAGGGTTYLDGATYPFDVTRTLYAQWTALPTVTVTFDGNGGTGSMGTESDNVPTALTGNSFSNPGFAFAGWNTIKAGGGTTYLDGAIYPFDVTRTLYAQWTALPNQTVTFDGNGGTGSMGTESDNVPTALTANGFSNPGFAFAGWNTIKAGGGTTYLDGATYPFDTTRTLYAEWTVLPNQTVTFDANGGTGSMTPESDNVPAALTANTFSNPGFAFAGWNTIDIGGGTTYLDGATYPFDTTRTLYAQWTALPNQTVTFNGNGGTGTMGPESDNVPTDLTANGFTWAGFTFTGWNTASDGSGFAYADEQSYPFDASTILYAQWTAISNKTVTFDANGGTGSMNPESDNVPAALTANTYTNPGFTFAGWNTINVGGGTSYLDGATYPFGSSGTLYAQWTAIPDKTVAFDPNGGTGSMTPESDNVPTALTANAFSHAGYNFVGWNTQANGSGAVYLDGASYAFATDATMFAQWTAKPILTFDPNGGTGSIAPLISDVPTNLPTTTVTKPGYTFTGWNTAADGSGTEYAPGAMYPFSASGTLYAQFSKVILATTGVNPTPGLNLAMLLIVLGAVLMAVVAVVRRKRGGRATS